MVDSNFYVNNPLNNSMKNGEINIGVVSAPDYIPQYHIYKPSEGYQMFDTLQKDVFQETQKAKPKKKKSLPKILKYLLGTTIIAGICLIAKKPISKFFARFKKN